MSLNSFSVFSKFLLAAKKLIVGDPDHPDTFVGAINTKQHLEKIQRFVYSNCNEVIKYRKTIILISDTSATQKRTEAKSGAERP